MTEIEPSHRPLAFDPTPRGLPKTPFREGFPYLWKRLHEERFKDGDYSCETCKSIGGDATEIPAHEVYSYPNSRTIRLDRVAFICGLCHDTIHLERLRREKKPPYIQKLEMHYRDKNGGLSQQDLERDFARAQERSRSIAALYAGKIPELDYGPFQESVNQALKRREENPPQKPLMTRLRQFAQSQIKTESAADPQVEALAQALAFNDLQGELPLLRTMAVEVLRDLTRLRLALLPGRGSSMQEALSAGRDEVLIEGLARALHQNGVVEGLPYLRVVSEGVIRDLLQGGFILKRTRKRR